MIPFATIHGCPEEVLQALSALQRNQIRRFLDEQRLAGPFLDGFFRPRSPWSR